MIPNGMMMLYPTQTPEMYMSSGWAIETLIAHGLLVPKSPRSRNKREGSYGGQRKGQHMRSSGWRYHNQGVNRLQARGCEDCGGNGGRYLGYPPDDYWWEDCGTCSGKGRY